MRRPATALVTLLLPLLGGGAAASSTVAERVLDRLQAERADAGLDPLERAVDLDALAAGQAARLAEMPQRRRRRFRPEPARLLRREGVPYRSAVIHVDSNLGYRDPADGFMRSWRASPRAWSGAMMRGRRQFGIASLQAGDGWSVLVALFVEPRPTAAELPPPEELERAAVRAVDRARRARGLPSLQVNDTLARVARGHSEEMALGGYFAHVSPDGRTVGDRVAAAGIVYRLVGENLHSNRHVDDPVATAVDAWLNSPDHRGMMLSEEYTETGIGVAVDYRGTIFFTQMFIQPDRRVP